MFFAETEKKTSGHLIAILVSAVVLAFGCIYLSLKCKKRLRGKRFAFSKSFLLLILH